MVCRRLGRPKEELSGWRQPLEVFVSPQGIMKYWRIRKEPLPLGFLLRSQHVSPGRGLAQLPSLTAVGVEASRGAVTGLKSHPASCWHNQD